MKTVQEMHEGEAISKSMLYSVFTGFLQEGVALNRPRALFSHVCSVSS